MSFYHLAFYIFYVMLGLLVALVPVSLYFSSDHRARIDKAQGHPGRGEAIADTLYIVLGCDFLLGALWFMVLVGTVLYGNRPPKNLCGVWESEDTRIEITSSGFFNRDHLENGVETHSIRPIWRYKESGLQFGIWPFLGPWHPIERMPHSNELGETEMTYEGQSLTLVLRKAE